MKATVIACFVFFSLVVAIIFNSIYIEREVSRLCQELEAVDVLAEGCAEQLEKIRSDFERSRRFISLSVSHDDFTSIEEGFAEIIGAARAGDQSALIIAKSRLADALLHLGRLSGINIDSIM